MERKVIISSLAVLAVVGWGIYHYQFRRAAVPVNPVSVKVSKVQEVSVPQEVHAIGTIVARSVEITPEVAGHVEKILFQDGEYVKENTVLIQLDNAVYKAKADSSKAKLAYSRHDYKRKVLLGKQGAIAQQAIDQAEADYKEKKAEAEESDVMLNKMNLTAPFAGMVGKGRVNPGDYVTVGQSIVTLTDTKHLRVEFNVPEKYLPLLKKDQQVQLTTVTQPNKIFHGTVSFIAPTINVDSRSVALYADVSNAENLLAAGMFVDVTQSLGTQEKVLMIPARSLVPILDGQQVYKVVDGKAYSVNILIGKRTDRDVEVTQGLKPDDVVITDGQLKVRNSMPVKIG